MWTTLLIIGLGVVGLLAIPLTLTFRLAWPQTGANDATLSWAFGLIRVRLPVSPGDSSATIDNAATKEAHAQAATKPGKGASSKSKSKSKSKSNVNLLAALRHRPFRRRVLRFARDLWRAIQTRGVHLHMRLGLDDPADTGRLWAVVGPVSGALAAIRSASVRVEPEFTDAVAEVDSAGQVRVVPLRFVALGAGLLVSPAFWQGLRLARKPT